MAFAYFVDTHLRGHRLEPGYYRDMRDGFLVRVFTPDKVWPNDADYILIYYNKKENEFFKQELNEVDIDKKVRSYFVAVTNKDELAKILLAGWFEPAELWTMKWRRGRGIK